MAGNQRIGNALQPALLKVNVRVPSFRTFEVQQGTAFVASTHGTLPTSDAGAGTGRHRNRESFDTADIVTGNDSADIHAIAIIVNETLVTDVDSFNEIAANVSTLDVTFVFVQAKRTSGFYGAAILRIGSGVMDFFSE